jgi:hypothetical protein
MKFELSKKEELAAKEFEKEHRHKDVYKGPIGGHIEYTFIPTSIGTAVAIRCSICDAIENITDYDIW